MCGCRGDIAGEDALQNLCANGCGFAVAVVFPVELCFQRLADRFDDPVERFQELLLTGRVGFSVLIDGRIRVIPTTSVAVVCVGRC